MGFLKGKGINFRREFDAINKNRSTPLQPVFEAISNSLESIFIGRKRKESNQQHLINIDFYFLQNVLQEETDEIDFQKIIIRDSGIGLEDTEYRRFIDLRDDSKGFSNKGTGRVQFLHYFDRTEITSVFMDSTSNTGFKTRELVLSKSNGFLVENAYINLVREEEIDSKETYTELKFQQFIDDNDKNFYLSLTAKELKEEIIRRYLGLLCEHRAEIPIIDIKIHVNDQTKENEVILEKDIPLPAKQKIFNIAYSDLESNKIIITSEEEQFTLKSFILPQNEIKKNSLHLVSKGELAKKIKLDHLLETDEINGNRFLFILSSNYLDKKDSDIRGQIDLITRSNFIKQNKDSLESDKEILLDDIEDITNEIIIELHHEILEKTKERDKEIEELQKMFLLDPNIIKSLRKKIYITDSDDEILRKVYQEEMKSIAKVDAEIKKKVKELSSLDPSNNDYQNELSNQVDDFIKVIPQQNRSALAQYVARRKLVLDLFDKILFKEIEKLSNSERIDEKILHNVIFQQSSENPGESDLWLIEEEFIYFKGYSEFQLDKIEIDGIKLFKDSFTEEVNQYLNSLKEKRLTKRPDVLLFPQEGKCIIIEFKAPDVNVAVHLNQVNLYANLIRNYTNDNFEITTFYGYLIGESIEDKDVRSYVSAFRHSPHFNYWYKPAEDVIGYNGRSNGSIYTEVIKYSTLLERARLRNKIFIDKLTKGNNQ